jgi:hypothetical protein
MDQTHASFIDGTKPPLKEAQRSETDRTNSPPVSLVGRCLKDLGALDSESSLKPDTLAALRTGSGGHGDFAAEFKVTGRVKESGSLQGIQIELHDGRPLLRDGRHRLTVAREQGRTTIYGQVYDGDRAPGKAPIFEGEIPIAVRERSRGTLTSTVPADRYELEMFKSSIDLSAFAASRGYRLDRRDSSARNRVMRLGAERGGDKINISRAPDGHWQYYSIRNSMDNGTIIDFVQNRAGGKHVCPLGHVRKELREWTNTERELPEFARVVMKPIEQDFEKIAREVASSKVLDTHPYLVSRGLRPLTLTDPRFRGTWREAEGPYRNVMFPHHNSTGVSGYEMKNHGFTGFSSGGTKGLWVSNTTPTDNRLVITESAIDAMSYAQVNPHPRARYISLGGKENPDQPGLLEKAISWMPAGSTVVAATDHDKDGRDFATRIAALCQKHTHVAFERHEPKRVHFDDGRIGKDWNDIVQWQQERSRPLCAEPRKSVGLER